MIITEKTTKDRQLLLRNFDFKSAISLELIDGLMPLHKFGEGTIDTGFEIIWDLMATQALDILIDENVNMTIVSTDALDVDQLIEVQYVEYIAADDSWVYKKAQAITAGLVEATIQEIDDDDQIVGPANIMIPFRMINKGTGITNEGGAVGVITLENGGVIYNAIQNGNNQSLTTIFPVATGYSIVIGNIGRSIVGSNQDAEFHYKAIPYGEPSQVKRTVGITEGANPEPFDLPYCFGEKTILTIEGRMLVSTAIASAWFDAYLVDNTKYGIEV